MYKYIKVIDILKDFQVQTMKQRLKYFQFQIIILMYKQMKHFKNTTYYTHDGHNIKLVKYLNLDSYKFLILILSLR